MNVLDVPMGENDAEAATVRDYLKDLLSTLWREEEGFSGKRPFGNSGWKYELYAALTAAGLIRRIEPAGSPARFEGRIGDNHHHLVCRSCGTVTDVACAVGEAPCLTAADDHGFSIDEAEVIYWGLCPSCTART